MDYNLITSVVSISDHFAESDFIYWHYFLVIVKGISVFLFYFWVTQQRSGGCVIRTVFTLPYKSTYLRFWRGRIHGPDSNLQRFKANPLRCMFMSFFSFFLIPHGRSSVSVPFLNGCWHCQLRRYCRTREQGHGRKEEETISGFVNAFTGILVQLNVNVSR